ncbi:MAG TPA: exodeoxyribonuclease VII small subunit [Candidatus Saccharimonadia bacterium]|nr:exodeoxyribonuclease VII small subunit [Candidatus Saccharimonadia bacterium]
MTEADAVPAPLNQAELAAMPFDVALAEYQAVVARLETGGLTLEASIALYERGVALDGHCSRLLADADLRVQRLVEAFGGQPPRLIDLDPGDNA